MSDKSFGDHTNRNIVKNPLLSSAVTGLSLEDLTHKAVLLPVTPSQDQITRPDQQQGSQDRTLANVKHDTPVFPSGDAFSSITLSNSQQNVNQNVINKAKNANIEENRNVQTETKSKASAKSDDDFDVNEYIARLQGTRYVSAPLHSHLKEDQNTNLEATEENLEEINLNETAPAEIQQSLTADIAQNFSQLPTVLPHVASAVFSSFSNMLNYKKDQTPDRPNVKEADQSRGYDEVQFQRPPDVGVPLMGVEKYRELKEVAPPPKEPPSGPPLGVGSYRITTKKKYAQIPGLSSGDAAQAMAYPLGQSLPMSQNLPPVGQNIPPMSQNMSPFSQNVVSMSQNMPPMGQNTPIMGQNMPPIGQNTLPMAQNMPPLVQNVPLTHQNMPPVARNLPPTSQTWPYISQMPTMAQNMPHVPPSMPPNNQNIPQVQPSAPKDQMDFITSNISPSAQNVPPIQNTSHLDPLTSPFGKSMLPVGQNITNIFDPNKYQVDKKASEVTKPLKSQEGEANTQVAATQSHYNIFSSVSATENKQASENQPNFFVNESLKIYAPAETKDQNITANPAGAAIIPPPPMFSNLPKRDSQQSTGKSLLPPSVARRISANQPIIKTATSTPSFSENIFIPTPVSDTTSKEITDNTFSSGPSSAFAPTYGSLAKSDTSSIITPQTQMSSNKPPTASTAPLTYFTSSIEEKSQTPEGSSPMASTSNTIPPYITPTMLPAADQSPLMTMSANIPVSSITSANLPPTSTIFTPNTELAQNVPPPMFQPPPQNVPPPTVFNPVQESLSSITPHPITQMPPMATPEPPKPIAEPPKATSAVNFRLNKKRLQYYAGPIQGVGAISNNVKPVIAPVLPSSAPIEGGYTQGAFFSPEQSINTNIEHHTTPNLEQASVPFDISKPVQCPSGPTVFDISSPQAQIYGTSFEIKKQPESLNYEQEYNTPFDTSVNPNDPYNQPKEESKGFGIIGSLKSKLSAIDINKIQNTVTTFFDPAYNNTKVAEPVAHDNMPNQLQQQFGQSAQGQSNFDIFVPNIEQNQHSQIPTGYDYSQSSQYYQTQDQYMQQGHNQNMTSYSTSSYFTDPNYSTEQVFSNNPLYDNTQSNYAAMPTYNPQENIPVTVNTANTKIDNTAFYNPNSFTQEIVAVPGAQNSQFEETPQSKDEENNEQMSQYNVNYFDPNAHINMTKATEQSQTQLNVDKPNATPVVGTESALSMTYHNPEAFAQENRQIWEPQQQCNEKSESFFQPTLEHQHKDTYIPTAQNISEPMFYNPNAFLIENQSTQAQKLLDSEIQESTKKIEGVTSNVYKSTSEVPSYSQSTCDTALNTSKYNMSSIQTPPLQHNVSAKETLLPAASFFDVPVATCISQYPQDNKNEMITSPQTVVKNPEVDKNVGFFGNLQGSYMPLPIGSKSQDDAMKGGENKGKGNDVKEKTLIESLSKDEIPVFGVSTVPLFGLSAMIADKSKEFTESEKEFKSDFYNTTQSKNLFEEKATTSVFTRINPENKIISEDQVKAKPLDITALSINDVKNVVVLEPPLENIESMLKRNLSSNKLESQATDKSSGENFEKCVAFPDQTEKFFKLSDDIPREQIDSQNIATANLDKGHSELNICGTCREVSTPENENQLKESEDVTSQLVENITSRLQLLNPVTVPFVESDAPIEIIQCNQQLDEITHVAEETFETLRMQSATELLDEPITNRTTSEIRDYGWVTQETVYPTPLPIDHDYTSKGDSDSAEAKFNYGINMETSATTNPAQDYDFKLDPNAVGFFGNNSLFFDNVPVPTNASDEIKAEIKHSHDDVVLPRQMSVPTAPPEEEDSKSEEPGVIDVHSIEQDAKNDFPIEEEFIIEPSTDEFLTTDDDKIESRERKRSSEDSFSNDTFTNRIERFKKTNDNNDGDEQNEYNSPQISMASYFDTGNYAVESHYRNTFGGMRIPPGFEEEYAKKLSGVSQGSPNKSPEPYIPDTTTQTKSKDSCSYMSSDAKVNIVGIKMRREENEEALAKALAEIASEDNKTMQIIDDSNKENHAAKLFDTQTKQPELSSPFLHEHKSEAIVYTPITMTDIIQPVSLPDNVKNTQVEAVAQNVHPLPDPINFFAKTEEEPKAAEPEAAPESFSRLASYFSMPPAQPEHSKSFFELSQSQNHYRHKPKTTDERDVQKSFFELSQSQNHYMDDDTKQNLKDLMKDLTSPQNIKDNIVRTLNYFTVELDNNIKKQTTSAAPINIKDLNETNIPVDENIKHETNAQFKNKPDTDNFNSKNKTKIKLDEKCNSKNKAEVKTDEKCNSEVKSENDEHLNDIIKCKYCFKYISGIHDKRFTVKSAVNSSDPANEANMPNQSEGGRNSKNCVNFANDYDIERQAEESVAITSEHRGESEYIPVKPHWYYRVDVEEKSVWKGFSVIDSSALEEAFQSPELNENTLVATDGGRYDVNVMGRLRIAIYWNEKPSNVRRCSWFYKGTTDARYVPYTEAVAEKLEEEYRHGITTGVWHRKLVLANNELVIMHGPTVMVHFLHSTANETFTPPNLLGKRMYRSPLKIKVARDQEKTIDHLILLVHGAGEYKRMIYKNQPTSRPRVVRRSFEESEIEDSEPSKIDHLLLLCHGVGSACDMRFRSVEEVVEDFRTTSLQLLQSHYKNSYDNGIVSRVEVLPISWHEQLHSGEQGVDRRLACVTLDSIPRLRAFTNHTVLDVLFYTSPVFHQTIIDTVCSELNRVYDKFMSRNPHFKGGVSLGGHSLGSVILYDLLCHQMPESPSHRCASKKTHVSGCEAAPTHAHYPRLNFPPDALYALGSPIAIFECIRGVETLGKDFALPTCKNFFNIFHPYDPIAYRIEPLIDPQLQDVKPSQIPHHKGRKRMHLELKDTMARVGADLKQKLIESLRTTWNKWKATPPTESMLEKVVEEEMEKENLCEEKEEVSEMQANPEMLGRLNSGRRVDYVLQEAPLEMINEYLFAMSSHVGYWESEDTMLLMLREIYSSLGVQPDCTVPQQSMTVQRTKIVTPQNDDTITNGSADLPSTSRGSTR